MRGRSLIVLFLVPLAAAAAPALAQENVDLVFAKKPSIVDDLEFHVAVPEQWQVHQDHTGFVVRDRARRGFQVTREPMLLDPDTFDAAWQAQLATGGIHAAVKKTRGGRYSAWQAAWTNEDGRAIEVWRLLAEENEMLYNIAFSAAKGVSLEPLVDGVMRSFKCLAPKARLTFQPTATAVGRRLFITLPVGFTQVPRGVRLGGGDQIAWVQTMKGYTPEHQSGRIGIRGLPTGGVLMPDGSVIQGSNVKEVSSYVFKSLGSELGEIDARPRQRPARYNGMRGVSMSGDATSKEGVPKEVYVFAGKAKRAVIVVTVVADQRLVRLHRDFFKQVCGKVEIEEN